MAIDEPASGGRLTRKGLIAQHKKQIALTGARDAHVVQVSVAVRLSQAAVQRDAGAAAQNPQQLTPVEIAQSPTGPGWGSARRLQ